MEPKRNKKLSQWVAGGSRRRTLVGRWRVARARFQTTGRAPLTPTPRLLCFPYETWGGKRRGGCHAGEIYAKANSSRRRKIRRSRAGENYASFLGCHRASQASSVATARTSEGDDNHNYDDVLMLMLSTMMTIMMAAMMTRAME